MKNIFYKIRKYIIRKLGGTINPPLFENSDFLLNYSYIPFEKFVVTKRISNVLYDKNPIYFYNYMQEILASELSQELIKSGCFKMRVVENDIYEAKDFTIEMYVGKTGIGDYYEDYLK